MAEKSVRLQLEEIQTSKDRSYGYGLLIHLHRLSADDASIMESIALFSPPLIPTILSDSRSTDEEIAVLAIKCLGFTLYHPSLAITLSDEIVQLALDSVIKLINSTQVKTVCNLGVWCLSVQQLKASLIKSRTNSLIRTITYALDNPFGSLSVTYEAIQALTKLSTQIPEEMKKVSNVWGPSIYKRLLSNNKTERDMSERCLHKLSSLILPPQILLSKEVASDLKRNILGCMVEMVRDDQKKIQAIKAWGWFISLLGYEYSENIHIINKLLKILEKTFTDRDPQIQIATLASWRHLIDAFPSQIINYPSKIPSEETLRPLIKKIKLILIPLKGLMSSKCGLSVHTSSLNVWLYLLHKLDSLINQPLILDIAFGSILETIFTIGPEMPLWKSCIDLVHEYILLNIKEKGLKKDDLLVEYSIKWLRWDATHLDFHLKIIGFIINVEKSKDKSIDSNINRELAIKAGLKIFKSLLQGINNEMKLLKYTENIIYTCIKSILKFIKELCEASWSQDSLEVCSEFIRAIWEELECIYMSLNKYTNHGLKSVVSEGVSEMVTEVINENNYSQNNNAIISFIGEIIIPVSENSTIWGINEEGFDNSPIRNCLVLISRFFVLVVLNLKSNSPAEHIITNRVLGALAGFIARFVLRNDIHLFFELISDPLVQFMLSCSSMYGNSNQSIFPNLEIFWSRALDCLKRNHILFDSSFFEAHSSLFQTALNHPHLPISYSISIFLKLSPNNAGYFENFQVLSKLNKCHSRNKAIEGTDEEIRFVNVSTGLKRKILKITKYTSKAKGLEVRDNCGNLIGSGSKNLLGVSSKRELVRNKMRKPELILQMLERK